MNPPPIKPVGAKRGTFRCLTALAITIPLLSGCNDSSPTAPKLVAVAPTPAPPAVRSAWILTDEVIGASGPKICLYRPSVGMVFQTTFELQRSGNSVSFVFPDPIDWESYTATVNGANFTATNPTVGSGTGMCIDYLQASSLSGSFSQDGNHLTATEVWSLTLYSGEVVTTTFRWTANRI
jgi:hypothetical protein